VILAHSAQLHFVIQEDHQEMRQRTWTV